jgi:starch synthase
VGIHEGDYKGVKVYFLHNAEMFPSAFAGDDPLYTIKSMALYARVSLELMCRLKIIPALIVTNDWFTGLLPGYVKNRTYGDTFSGTKIFHIAHNLDPNYEVSLKPLYID